MNQQRDLYDKSYIVALRFLSHKPRTEEEVRRKLISFWYRKKDDIAWSSNDLALAIESVIQTLLDEKFLNDTLYIDSYLSYQMDAKKKSTSALKDFLLSKGLNKQLVEERIVTGNVNDASVLDTLTRKKYKILSLKDLPESKIKQKLVTYLLGKGFQYDEVFNAVDRVMGVK